MKRKISNKVFNNVKIHFMCALNALSAGENVMQTQYRRLCVFLTFHTRTSIISSSVRFSSHPPAFPIQENLFFEKCASREHSITCTTVQVELFNSFQYPLSRLIHAHVHCCHFTAAATVREDPLNFHSSMQFN